MTRALVTSSKYSPGNMTPEALESLFVGRARVLEHVLKRLADSALSKDKHYFLLVGARGMGKTHFVALLHHRISHDPAYAAARKRLLIAYLNEEEWGVASFLDLLVRILQALAANDPTLTARIEPIYTTYTKDPAAAQAAAQALLIDVVGNRTLLLICENLTDLFDGMGEEGQKRWRAFIQEHPFWTILATTPQMFDGIQLHKSPFYGFFTIRHLDRLDFETAAQLLQQKAALDGRTDLADLLSTPIGRARARAIHHLAGGNHRAYVTLSDFLTRESLDDLVTPFMRMVDDMTPYYQDRIRQLAPQQRKLIEFLSRVERPTIVKDIATRCLISQQTAAKQLGELTRLGFVEREKSGRETYYELSEPLMRICVEVKDNRTEHIKLFVSLLREWFSGSELQAHFDQILRMGAIERRVDRVHLAQAIKEWKSEATEPFLTALAEEAAGCIKRADYKSCVKIAERALESVSDPIIHVFMISSLRNCGDLRGAELHATVAADIYPQDARIAFAAAESHFALNNWQLALAQVDRAIALAPDELEYQIFRAHTLSSQARPLDALTALDNAKARFVSSKLDNNAEYTIQRVNCLFALSRYADAIIECKPLKRLQPQIHAAFMGISLAGAHRFDEGLKWLTEVTSEHAPNDWLTNVSSTMMLVELAQRGPTSMTAHMGELRSNLSALGQETIMSLLIGEIARWAMVRTRLENREWLVALPLLRSALADLPECALPLAMLSVGIRHVQNNDRNALLELPLEQRTLLLEAIDPPPPPEETSPIAPPRPKIAKPNPTKARPPARRSR